MITYLIIAVTAIISIRAFRDHSLTERFIFYPPAVKYGEWHRLFTYGVLHADYTHLIFNMFTLYFFGMDIEKAFQSTFGVQTGSAYYILLYITALPVSILPTYLRHKDNQSYHGVGASGSVSAIIFAYILINPMNFMGILFIPIWLPAFIFGIIFIAMSLYLDKKQSGGINHSAHITGGIYGLIFMIMAFMLLQNINLAENFIAQIRFISLNDLIRFGY